MAGVADAAAAPGSVGDGRPDGGRGEPKTLWGSSEPRPPTAGPGQPSPQQRTETLGFYESDRGRKKKRSLSGEGRRRRRRRGERPPPPGMGWPPRGSGAAVAVSVLPGAVLCCPVLLWAVSPLPARANLGKCAGPGAPRDLRGAFPPAFPFPSALPAAGLGPCRVPVGAEQPLGVAGCVPALRPGLLREALRALSRSLSGRFAGIIRAGAPCPGMGLWLSGSVPARFRQVQEAAAEGSRDSRAGQLRLRSTLLLKCWKCFVALPVLVTRSQL